MMMQSFSLVFLSCCYLHLWWLISSVNLTWPWCPERWSSSILAISVRVFHWVGPMFKSVNFESSKLPSLIWVGLIQPVEALLEKKTDLPWARRNSTSRLLWTHISAFPWVSNYQPPPSDFGFIKPPQSQEPIKRNLFVYIHVQTFSWFCVPGEPCLTR